MSEMFRLTKKMCWSFPFTALILIITVLILFRQLWPPVLAAIAAAIGVVWTMGVSVLIDPQISIMHSIAPMVMLIVASSDVIHLCSAYMLELGHGKSRREAILDSTAEVGRACLFTSMTTFVGFVGLSFVLRRVSQGHYFGMWCRFRSCLLSHRPIAWSMLPTCGWKSTVLLCAACPRSRSRMDDEYLGATAKMIGACWCLCHHGRRPAAASHRDCVDRAV